MLAVASGQARGAARAKGFGMRILGVTRRATIALATLLLVAADCSPPAPETAPVACRIHAEFQRQARASTWPGFAPARDALAVFDGESTWVFGYPRPLTGFSADARCPGAQRAAGRHANVRANTSIEWDGVAVATLLAAAAHADSVAAYAATAIHECFHLYQRARHPRWSADEGALFEYPAEDESLLAWSKLEMEALRRGIAAESDAESARWARTATEYRKSRAARMPAAAIAYERNTECNEGLAQYVEHRALERATGVAAASRARLSDDYPADGVRWRCYASGEAWALLLDRHRRNWRRRLVERDTVALDVWLAQARPVANAAPALVGAATVARLETAARYAVASLREARVDEGRRFMAQPGHTLVFEAATGPWWPEKFDPLNVRLLNDGVVLHKRWLRIGNETDRIEILDCVALSEPAGAHPLFGGVRRLVIAGLAAPPALVGSDSTLVVQAAGVEATLRHAVVATAGNATVVRAGR